MAGGSRRTQHDTGGARVPRVGTVLWLTGAYQLTVWLSPATRFAVWGSLWRTITEAGRSG